MLQWSGPFTIAGVFLVLSIRGCSTQPPKMLKKQIGIHFGLRLDPTHPDISFVLQHPRLSMKSGGSKT